MQNGISFVLLAAAALALILCFLIFEVFLISMSCRNYIGKNYQRKDEAHQNPLRKLSGSNVFPTLGKAEAW